MIRPDAVHLYAYPNGSRSDITPYFVGCSARWGMRTNSPTDRVADVGSMDVTLKNTNGEFTPGHANCLSGWKKGIFIVLSIAYDGVSYVRFRGTVERIRFDAGAKKGPRLAYITVLDWMKFGTITNFSSAATESTSANKASGTKSVTVTININKLIDKFEINTNKITESYGKITEHVANALLQAANDASLHSEI